jgi:hypothetical protein
LSSCSCCHKTDIGQEDFAFVSRSKKAVSIVYRRFPTHLASYYRKDGTPGKFYKISGQRIYDGSLPFVIRAKLMSGLKDRFSPMANSAMALLGHGNQITIADLKFEYGTPINYGDVRMLKGKLSWKQPEHDYVPRWDASNLWPIRKSIEDSIVDAGIIPDDNVGVVQNLAERVRFVETLDDRYIRVIITTNHDEEERYHRR